jgi:hypothetical protein
MSGGQVDQTNGLGSIVVKRQAGRRVGSNVVLDLVPPPSPPEDILKETNEKRVERIFPGFKPKTLEEEFPEFRDNKGSRFTRTLASTLSGARDFVTERSSQLGRDFTSIGEYLFEKKGQTPLSLGQIRTVQELEARRPDLARTGAIRASAKKILENATRDGKEVSPFLLAKTISLDLRPEEEVGQELAAEYAMADNIDPTQPTTPISSLKDDPSIVSKADPYGIGVIGELGTQRKKIEQALPKQTSLKQEEGTGIPTKITPPPSATEEDSDFSTLDKGAGYGDSRTLAGFNQQAGDILKNKPAAEKTLTSFGKEISDLRKTLDERSEKKKTTAQRRKDNIERDKFLTVAQMGLNILAQDGGQTFLQAIGKGSKNVIPTLMKLSREELEVAENLDDLDFETAKAKLGLTEAEFNRYVKQRNLDIAEREVETKRLIAQGEMGKEGAPLSMATLQGYARSITGLPAEALRDNKFLTDLAVKSREDAIKSLRTSGRGALVGDTGTVQSEQIRQIQLNPEKYLKLYGTDLLSKMGKNGAPDGNKPQTPSATDRLTDAQKGLRDSRTPPVTR